MTYDQILSRLESIESDLAERQGRYEQAAEDFFRANRDFALRLAKVKRATKADTETAKKDAALEAIAAADDDLYSRLSDAEARYESLKVAVNVLDKRASIGQSLLRASTRETVQTGQQPSWSHSEKAAVGA